MKVNYKIHVSSYDWGCAVSRVYLIFDDYIDSINIKDFKITEIKQSIDFSHEKEFSNVELSKERKVINSYLCNENGNIVSSKSKFACLELAVSPEEGSPIIFNPKTFFNTWCNPYYLIIEIDENACLTSNGNKIYSLIVEKYFISKTTDADFIKLDKFTSTDGITYNYGYFKPKEETENLIVWLHGLGEGGIFNTDPYVITLANKVTSLFNQEFQKIVQKAHILIPQCPTYWMDTDGKKSNLNNGSIIASNNSFYTKSLIELIDNYKKKIKAKKVILTGCSNGGFMTLILAINNPNEYDAIVPICEALPDKLITDDQITILSKIPMYFIYSKDDDIVNPEIHEIKTIERLQNANAIDLCVSTSEHVIDKSGKYKDSKGNNYIYPGHYSWIYFHNNESICDKTQIKVWDWIAKQFNSI